MTESPLYLSFGMPKSGSTLTFELTRTMLELAGVPQNKICEGVTDPETKINFVSRLDGEAYDALRREALRGTPPVAIKTHARLSHRVEMALGKGKVIGHAVCRDPRDMALSMLDAAKEGRAWGGGDAGSFRTVGDTVKRLHKSVEIFEKWANAPGIMAIHYERVAFDTERVAAEIAAQIGISVDIPKAIEIATGSRFTQLNHGKSQRWKTQMDAADALKLEKEFQEYIERWCTDVPDSPVERKPEPKGLLGKLFARKNRAPADR